MRTLDFAAFLLIGVWPFAQLDGINLDKLTAVGVLAAVLVWAIKRIESLEKERREDMKLVISELIRARAAMDSALAAMRAKGDVQYGD